MVLDVVGKSWLFEIVGISSIAGVGEMDRVDMMLCGFVLCRQNTRICPVTLK